MNTLEILCLVLTLGAFALAGVVVVFARDQVKAAVRASQEAASAVCNSDNAAMGRLADTVEVLANRLSDTQDVLVTRATSISERQADLEKAKIEMDILASRASRAAAPPPSSNGFHRPSGEFSADGPE